MLNIFISHTIPFNGADDVRDLMPVYIQEQSGSNDLLCFCLSWQHSGSYTFISSICSPYWALSVREYCTQKQKSRDRGRSVQVLSKNIVFQKCLNFPCLKLIYNIFTQRRKQNKHSGTLQCFEYKSELCKLIYISSNFQISFSLFYLQVPDTSITKRLSLSYHTCFPKGLVLIDKKH